MRVFTGQLPAVAVVAAVLAATAGLFAFARPEYRRAVLPPPADHGLPYTRAAYTAAGARRAFAAVGVRLGPRSRSATVTTLGNAGDVLEVDVFAGREQVERAGFWDYLVVDGRYVHFARDCRSSVPDAERWRGNVRAIVPCAKAGAQADAWLRRVERALARL